MKSDDLKERVLENEIKHNEKSHEGLKGNNQRLSAKIDGVYDKVSVKIDFSATLSNSALFPALFSADILSNFSASLSNFASSLSNFASSLSNFASSLSNSADTLFDKMSVENKAEFDKLDEKLDKVSAENKAEHETFLLEK